MNSRVLCLALLSLACSKATPAAAPLTPQVSPEPRVAATPLPDRPADDIARDADRKPAEILDFLGVKTGDTVADLMAGRGYYTEVLAGQVGAEGTVFCQNNAYVIDRFAGEDLASRLARPGLSQVKRVDAELEVLNLPKEGLDSALMALFYHDSVWMETDRAAMNRAVFGALKPGGVYVVIDHHAQANSGLRDVKTLHRIDREVVVTELVAAGFVLDGESDALKHAEDDRTRNVFEDGLRGKTDRFVLRFRKPAAE